MQDERRNAIGHGVSEQVAYGVVVLGGAFRALCEQGWCPPHSLHRIGNRPPPPGLSLGDSLWEGAPGDKWQAAYVEYARRLLNRIAGDFHAWERHPLRSRLDVLRLIQAACMAAGHEAPELPARMGQKRRGGWVVSTQATRRAVREAVLQ